ncbi:MAG: TetR/AcrR family transcriptional regulator C-terminal domain-containing protein [Actinomycetota bacterium]|nr:TetR/AcrR family transcriptional regulator C-terminal domain-containing protein [Actinomycetota bacterium]
MSGTERVRHGLTRQVVLDAAMRLADESGTAALSMRKVADALGSTPMALYNHVANKADLITGLRDRVLDEIDPPGTDGDWRVEMRRNAVSTNAALRRHPWISDVWLQAGVTHTMLRSIDARLACLRAAGFGAEAAYSAYHVLDNYVTGYSHQQSGFDTAFPTWRDGGLREVAGAALATEGVDELPHLVEHIRLHLDEPGHSHAGDFELGLDLLLDGLERLRTTT